MLGDRFAARLNSFNSRPPASRANESKPQLLRLLVHRVLETLCMTDIDLNYPDHVVTGTSGLFEHIEIVGLRINGLAIRYYSDPAFEIGAFTNPDRRTRRKAIDLTKRGMDAAREVDCSLMTIWLGQDGYDYSFQTTTSDSGTMRSRLSARLPSMTRSAR